MTGLDVEKDQILEMACLITDSDLNVLAEVRGSRGPGPAPGPPQRPGPARRGAAAPEALTAGFRPRLLRGGLCSGHVGTSGHSGPGGHPGDVTSRGRATTSRPPHSHFCSPPKAQGRGAWPQCVAGLEPWRQLLGMELVLVTFVFFLFPPGP